MMFWPTPTVVQARRPSVVWISTRTVASVPVPLIEDPDAVVDQLERSTTGYAGAARCGRRGRAR
jgi:hypothetical protein